MQLMVPLNKWMAEGVEGGMLLCLIGGGCDRLGGFFNQRAAG